VEPELLELLGLELGQEQELAFPVLALVGLVLDSQELLAQVPELVLVVVLEPQVLELELVLEPQVPVQVLELVVEPELGQPLPEQLVFPKLHEQR
jgi:hypothetical protein